MNYSYKIMRTSNQGRLQKNITLFAEAEIARWREELAKQRGINA